MFFTDLRKNCDLRSWFRLLERFEDSTIATIAFNCEMRLQHHDQIGLYASN